VVENPRKNWTLGPTFSDFSAPITPSTEKKIKYKKNVRFLFFPSYSQVDFILRHVICRGSENSKKKYRKITVNIGVISKIQNPSRYEILRTTRDVKFMFNYTKWRLTSPADKSEHVQFKNFSDFFCSFFSWVKLDEKKRKKLARFFI